MSDLVGGRHCWFSHATAQLLIKPTCTVIPFHLIIKVDISLPFHLICTLSLLCHSINGIVPLRIMQKYCTQRNCWKINATIASRKTCNIYRVYRGWKSFLAHLSRRLIGELIVYPCSGVRPSSVVRPSVVHNFKDLLL